MAVGSATARADSDKDSFDRDAPANDDIDIDDTEIMKDRSRDLSKSKKVKDYLIEMFAKVEQGFTDQWERSDDQMDYWDIYNCKLGPKQFYVGTSKIYVPAVHDAVNARKTRFSNQIFPQSGRNVDVTSHTGDIPYDIVALLEHYIRLANLRTKIPALIRNGDVEGQYNICVTWTKRKHKTVHRGKEPVEIDGVIEDPTDEVDTLNESDVEVSYPDVEILHDADILVLPAVSDSLEEAIAAGGSVTILRRWTKAKIKLMIEEGAIREDMGEALIDSMGDKTEDKINAKKQMVDAAGIKSGQGGKFALVYETWTNVKVGKEWHLCKAYYGGEQQILGCKRNPNWSDKIDIISCPVEKVAGSFKGQSKIKFSADLQYGINDAINEGMDAAQYSLMPIVMTDPEKNPRIGSMVLNMASIWQTSPKDTQFVNMPALWKDAFELVGALEGRIQKNLSVSPAAITQSGGAKGAKRNQAEIAQEQQVDILSTADAVTVIEQGILSPLLQHMVELDHQYRDKELTVRQYGEMGYRANMQEIPPVQWDARYEFKWLGVESARNAQQIQQKIAMLNVLRGIPPQSYAPRKLNIEPVITQLIEDSFGPRLAALMWGSNTSQLSVDPETENDMLAGGLPVQVHPTDDDTKHLKAHVKVLQAGDPSGQIRVHIMAQAAQMQAKQKAQMMQMLQQQGGGGQPGVPGGAGPGVAGTPRVGAQPGQPRTQGPPGMIHQDQMQDPNAGPRQT
jgi:hypothetical protein